MQGKPPNQKRYFNTLIFAVIALVMTVAFLVAVIAFKDTMAPMYPMVVTIEVGLILVLLYTLWNVMSNEKRLDALRLNAYNNKLQVDSCPDYWTRNGDKCYNSFRPADNASTRYEIKNTKKVLDLNDYNNKKLRAACQEMRTNIQAPWTDMRSVCDGYK
jgi:hypothetical protein